MNKPNMQRIPDQRMINAAGYKDGTTIQRGLGGGGGLLPETIAYKARVEAAGGSINNTVIDYVYKNLKKYSLLDKLDTFYLTLQDDPLAANRCLINENYVLLHTGTPTHFPKFGFKGVRSNTSSINTQFNPSLAAKLTQNNASYGAFVFTEGAFGMYNWGGGDADSRYAAFATTSAVKNAIQCNSAGYTSGELVDAAVGVGLKTIVRDNASNQKFYQNTSTYTVTKASVPPPNRSIELFCLNNNGSRISFSDCGFSCFFAGIYLTQTDHLNIKSIIDGVYAINNEDPLKYAIKYNTAVFPGNVLIVGDSTSAEYVGYKSIGSFLTVGSGKTLTSIATPGENITQQKTRYDDLTTEVKGALDYIFIMVGLNELVLGETAAVALAKYQSLVDDINTNSPLAKIVVATMTPCRKTFGAYQKWLDMNEAIKGNGANAITGVDQRISAHTDLMNDGSGYLLPIYDYGDGVHENNYARSLIALEYVTAI